MTDSSLFMIWLLISFKALLTFNDIDKIRTNFLFVEILEKN